MWRKRDVTNQHFAGFRSRCSRFNLRKRHTCLKEGSTKSSSKGKIKKIFAEKSKGERDTRETEKEKIQ